MGRRKRPCEHGLDCLRTVRRMSTSRHAVALPVILSASRPRPAGSCRRFALSRHSRRVRASSLLAPPRPAGSCRRFAPLSSLAQADRQDAPALLGRCRKSCSAGRDARAIAMARPLPIPAVHARHSSTPPTAQLHPSSGCKGAPRRLFRHASRSERCADGRQAPSRPVRPCPPPAHWQPVGCGS